MLEPDRDIYIVSDLHIGGNYATPHADRGRGFRMCTRVDRLAAFCSFLAKERARGRAVELVVNGDFIDFLAEQGPEDGSFVPFLDVAERAVATLDRMAQRDAVFFSALRETLASGCRLTILLGNHDIELSFPAVRKRLAQLLGVSADSKPPGHFEFIYDGEAYVVGDALIEHGNRYDEWNAVDHDALRRMRSLQSRGWDTSRAGFQPPAGSVLVASVMNPIKRNYPFVDLLKPETNAAIPILLALEPSVRDRIWHILTLQKKAAAHAPKAPAEPSYSGDIAAMSEESVEPTIEAELETILGVDGANEFLGGIEENQDTSGDIASAELDAAWGIVRLLTASKSSALNKRLPALLAALRALQNDRTFDASFEPEGPYLDAARALAQRGIHYVVFGHTHLARHIDLGDGRTYFNSGTWADLIRFPSECLSGPEDVAIEKLRVFLQDLTEQRFDRWLIFRPTYVRLDMRGGVVARAELCTYDAP